MDESMVLAADSVHCQVETQAADRRGQTSFAKSGESLSGSLSGVVHKVMKVDTTKFAQAIDDSTNSEH